MFTDGAICEYLVVGNYIALDQCKTKQNFVVSKWGKGDSYVGGLDVSLKNWTLESRSRIYVDVTNFVEGHFKKNIFIWASFCPMTL